MKQKYFLLTLSLFSLFLLSLTKAGPVLAADIRAQKLAVFLSNYHSPLAYFAQDFITSADQNGLDYRLLVAISGVESTFGQNYIFGTYNVYGWGGGEIRFQSWPDGIAKVSEGLKKGYLDKGAKDVEQIAPIYCPPTSEHWATKVRYFMDKIEETAPSLNILTPAVSKQLPLTI